MKAISIANAATPNVLSARSPIPETPLTPSIKIHRSTPTDTEIEPVNQSAEETSPDPPQSRPGVRTPQRNSEPFLETVRESSVPSTPAIGSAEMNRRLGSGGNDEDGVPASDRLVKKSSKDSSGDSSDNPKEGRSRSRTVTEGQEPNKIHQRPPNQGAKSLSSVTSRSKPATDAGNNVTVETETVSSIPQVAVGGGTVDRIGAGRMESGLRSKTSSETIRQKPPKRRPPRKTPTVSGPASSKADNFEAKIIHAIDTEDGSDSEETFVYESDARDPYPPRLNRHHSRTPSTQSMASLTDPRALSRGISDGHVVVGKKSMKFANPTYGANGGETGELQNSRRGGRINGLDRAQTSYSFRKPGTPLSAQAELLATDGATSLKHDLRSPHSIKSPRSPLKLSNRQARLESPKNHAFQLGQSGSGGIGKKSPSSKFYPYDVDIEQADDESAPLITANRTMRRHSRRHGSSHGSIRTLRFYESQRKGYCARCGGCVILIISILLIILLGSSLLLSTTQPLKKVELMALRDVLASKDELMLKLQVQALNPNLIPVTIASMDISLFAKSTFLPEKSIRNSSSSSFRAQDDDPSDPAPLDPDPQTMLLGQVFIFDNPLTLDGSPVQRHRSQAVGEVRLLKPGNGTETGGTKRWEQVVHHKFELIVRGVLMYQLPLSSRVHSASVGARATVWPEADVRWEWDGEGL